MVTSEKGNNQYVVTLPMEKKAFLQQYVLNRALTVGNMSGIGATEEALKAWNLIEKENRNG